MSLYIFNTRNGQGFLLSGVREAYGGHTMLWSSRLQKHSMQILASSGNSTTWDAKSQSYPSQTKVLLRFSWIWTSRALEAQPNAAHFALASLSIPTILAIVAPSATFTLITQNVDGLSTRAFHKATAAALPTLQQPRTRTQTHSQMLEMHGRIFETICTSCNAREPNFDSPICEALRGTEIITKNHEPEPEIPLENLPRCKSCGGLLRPGVFNQGTWCHSLTQDHKGSYGSEKNLSTFVKSTRSLTKRI
jgi:NAD-dependent SIR2 family protein deacetylase